MKTALLSTVLILLFSLTLPAQDGRAGEEINWQVLSNGGSNCSSPNYKISGTLCQTATISMTSANYKIQSGFWQPLQGTPECQGICGNVNGDSKVNLADAVYMINYIFTHGPAPIPIIACMDANTDAAVNLADASYIINYVFFQGSPAPGDCSPGNGWIGGDCCPYIQP